MSHIAASERVPLLAVKVRRLSAGGGGFELGPAQTPSVLSWAGISSPPDAAQMDRERELKIIRRAYAKQVAAAAGVEQMSPGRTFHET